MRLHFFMIRLLRIQESDKLSNCSGLTKFEYINHDKVTFLSSRTSPNFSHFPRQVKRALPLNLAPERNPKNIFYYQRDVKNYTDQVLPFSLFDKQEYTHTESWLLLLIIKRFSDITKHAFSVLRRNISMETRNLFVKECFISSKEKIHINTLLFNYNSVS